MAGLYLRTVRVVVTVTAPMMLGLFVVRAPLVRLMFGSEWWKVAEVLAWLAPTGFIQSIVSTTGTVFMARGRTDTLLRLGVMSTVLYVTAFLLGARYGIVEVAAFYAVANVVAAIPCLWIVMRELGASPLRLLEAIAAPLGSAVVMALAITLLYEFVQVPPAYWREELAASVMLGALCYGSLLYLVFRQSPRDILTLLRGRGSPA
jgi:PST family polysaccharide transporter